MSKDKPIAFASRVGVFLNTTVLPTGDAQRLAREIESLGYGSLFFPEGGGKEALVQAASLLVATDRIVVGTGIANIYLRHAVSAEAGSRTLAAMYPRRFVLGLGVSHAPALKARFGVTATGTPLQDMSAYLDHMSAVSPELEPGTERAPTVLGAMGPKMIALSGEKADGAQPWFVTPVVTGEARAILDRSKWLIVGQPVALSSDKVERMQRAAKLVQHYAALPNYRRSWARQGFDEADLEGSPDLIGKLIGLGASGAAEAVRAQLDAGADHVLASVTLDDPHDDPLPQLRELAEALDLRRSTGGA